MTLLVWARRLQALAQTGLTYSKDPYDTDRYHEVLRIAAEMLSQQSEMSAESVLSGLSSELGYATPKVDIRGVVFKDEQILLTRERSDGLWTLPGGWADIGESPAEAVAREVMEETGYYVRAVRLLAVLDKLKHPHPPAFFHVYKIFIECEIIGGDAHSTQETDAVGFYGLDGLPPLSEERVTRSQIELLYAYHRDPSRRPTFD